MKFRLIPLAAALFACAPLSAMADASAGSGSAAPYKSNQKPAPAAAAAPAATSGGLTGTFDITTNYMDRGVSDSNNLPAVQGGWTYTFASTGIYFNLWGSSLNELDTQNNIATLELDTIIGITNPVGEHFTYNINITRYNYPKAAASYSELIASAQWYFITALIGYSTNVYDTHGNGTYYNLGFKYDVPPDYIFGLDNMNVSGGVGHYSLPARGGLSSYNDYNLAVTKTIGNYALQLQWTDTNGSSFRRFYDPAPPIRGSHFIGTVTYNF